MLYFAVNVLSLTDFIMPVLSELGSDSKSQLYYSTVYRHQLYSCNITFHWKPEFLFKDVLLTLNICIEYDNRVLLFAYDSFFTQYSTVGSKCEIASYLIPESGICYED